MTRLITIVCLVAAMLLTACADADDTAVGGPSPTETTTVAEATQPATEPATETATDAAPPPDASDLAPLPDPATGVLGLEDIEGGCVVIEIDGQRYQLVSAPDAEIVVDPGNGVIADTDGEVIARVGDTVTVQGVVDPGMMTFCQIGPVLLVDSVSVE